MANEGSLVVLTKAAQMLAEATTIQKAKEFKDLALSAAEYARQKHMGKAAIRHCLRYAIGGERKLGEFLAETERARGGEQYHEKPTGNKALPVPTSLELGLTKRESADATIIGKLPIEQYEALWEKPERRPRVLKEEKQRRRLAKLAEAQEKITAEARQRLSEICDVRHCAMSVLFSSGIKPDCIITDPPYGKEHLHLYFELAQAAENVPLVAVMCGQSYLPEILAGMCRHLKYCWTMAYLTPGGESAQLWERKVNTFWKPILLFGERQEWLGDVCHSKSNDKRFHGWGQSETGIGELVAKLTNPGELVCDPFCGGGTIALASLRLGCRFVGCDIDEESKTITLARCREWISSECGK